MISIITLGVTPAFPFRAFLPVVWQTLSIRLLYLQEFHEEFLGGAFTHGYDYDLRRIKLTLFS